MCILSAMRELYYTEVDMHYLEPNDHVKVYIRLTETIVYGKVYERGTNCISIMPEGGVIPMLFDVDECIVSETRGPSKAYLAMAVQRLTRI